MVLEDFIDTFFNQLVDLLPNILAGIIFLIVSYIGIKIVLSFLEYSLRSRHDQQMIISLISTIVSLFLWFGVILVFLNILGLGEIAASLGTSTGFIALGVAYALSDMLADTVSGYYLARDPDFNMGDKIKVEETEGELIDIGLRKSRIRLENDSIAVFSNSDIEKRWFKKSE